MVSQLTAFRIYFTNTSEDEAEKLLKTLSKSWETDVLVCEVALSSAPKLELARGWTVLCAAELREGDKAAKLQELFEALKSAESEWWMVEDVTRLNAETKTIEKFVRGLAEKERKGKTSS